MVLLKRIYETPAITDGYRILVDRLWPRGLSKEKAKVDLWLKEIAPSDNLRKGFHHEVGSWEEFERRYKEELTTKQDLLIKLTELEREHLTITLLYGAKDTKKNQAVILYDILKVTA